MAQTKYPFGTLQFARYNGSHSADGAMISAPGAQKHIAIHAVSVSVDAAIDVALDDEDDNQIMGTWYCAENGGRVLPFSERPWAVLPDNKGLKFDLIAGTGNADFDIIYSINQ